MTARPSHVRLRAYKVGSGDCLLLTVSYGSLLPDGRRERHMLIDCGTVRNADEGPTLAQVAEHLAEHCQGQLDVVVATHRRRDHIGGFGDPRARETLDRLNPRLVVRPWTEVPEDRRADPELGLDDQHQRFLGILDHLQPTAEAIARFAFDNPRAAARAAELAEFGLNNVVAIALLEDLGRRGRAEYARAVTSLDLTEEMPGVSVRVLGPPSLDDVPGLTRHAKESEEYWLALAGEDALTPHLEEGDASTLNRARHLLAEPGGVGAAEWLLRTLDRRRISQGLEIVEALDDVFNNTSLILLVTVGSRRLLLPGDAQAESWSPTLDHALGANGRRRHARLAAELSKVDLYKVGNHGRRNATPRRLTRHWEKRADAGQPVVSVLTTQHGVYEESTEGAAAKEELLTELGLLGPLHSIEDLAKDVWWMDLDAPARGRAAFTHSPGPPVGAPD